MECPELSKEITCPDCSENGFRCDDSKLCISNSLICDGKDDCSDGSDEKQQCNGMYKCVYIWYIYTFERKISQITFIHVACLAPDHLCGDSTTCIVSNKICDGIMDCQDNSDEFNCSSMFVFFI